MRLQEIGFPWHCAGGHIASNGPSGEEFSRQTIRSEANAQPHGLLVVFMPYAMAAFDYR